MPAVVRQSHSYPQPADLVWQMATDFGHLSEVTRGMVIFRGLPYGRPHPGQLLEVEVWLFGLLPCQPYEMELVDLDEADRRFTSSEKGAGVRRWEHRLQVVETATGARIDESLTIDAGRLAPAFAAGARRLYQRRHRPRLHLLGRLAATAPAK